MENEKLIIRTILLDSSLVDQVVAELEPRDFTDETFRKFFEGIVRMRNEGRKVGLPEVCIEVGEAVALTEGWVNADYTSAAHLDSYVSAVKKKSKLRQVKTIAKESNDVAEIIEAIKEIDVSTAKMPSLNETLVEYDRLWHEKLERRKEGRGIGICTGFKKFDEEVCLEPTHLITLGAKSSIGKSALALNLALGSAMYEQKTLFFSIEMREESLLNRACALLTSVPIYKFKRAEAEHSLPMAKKDFAVIQDHFKLCYLPRGTSDDICALASKEARLGGVDLIVVDYLQYLNDPQMRNETNNDRIGRITKKLKGLAGELNCSVIMLSQVNRKAPDEPELEHLRDSGNVEQDSDLVLMLSRESRDAKTARLIVKKAREGEAEIGINLKFDPLTTKFSEL